MALQYHQPIFDLLGIEPVIDETLMDVIQSIEQTYNIKLPKAVREYFSIANMLETLFDFSVFLEVNPLFLFGQLEHFEGLDDKHLGLLKNRKVIPLFTERHESWTWFLNLKDELEDPKVMLHAKDFPKTLISHPHKFSKQLYLSIWDTFVIRPRSTGFYMEAKYKSANNDILQILRFTMRELPTTYVLVANETTYRFESHGRYIAIVENGVEATWFFHAKDEHTLGSLMLLTKKIKNLTPNIQPRIWKFEKIKELEKKAIIERVLAKIS